MDERSRDDAIREIVDREEGTYGILNTGHTDSEDLDIFMMQIRGYIIVEYSKTGNAAYLYEATKLPFNVQETEYKDVSYLKIRENLDIDGKENRIVHQGAWEYYTEARLKRMDIFPDSLEKAKNDMLSDDSIWEFGLQGNQLETPENPRITIENLEEFINNFDDVRIEDWRSRGGRLWVINAHRYQDLEEKLRELGFRWSARRQRYYLDNN